MPSYIRKTGYYRKRQKYYRKFARKWGRSIYNTRPRGTLHTCVSKTYTVNMPNIGINYFFDANPLNLPLYQSTELVQLGNVYSRFKVVSATIYVTMANPNWIFAQDQLPVNGAAQFNATVVAAYQPAINMIAAPASTGEAIQTIAQFEHRKYWSSSDTKIQCFKIYPKICGGKGDANADEDGFYPLDMTTPAHLGNFYFGTDWWPNQVQYPTNLAFMTYHIEFTLRLTSGQ